MIHFNTLGKKIDSPLSAFNNFLIDIGKDLDKIFRCKIFETNNCIFEDNSIHLFGFIKLMLHNNDIGIQITDIIDRNNQHLLQSVLDNKQQLFSLLNKYIFIINDVRKNYDDTVTSRYIETIIESVNKNESKYFHIPFQHKIQGFIDKSLLHVINKNTFVLRVKTLNPIAYTCDIIRLESSILDESISIENTRFMEKEIMLTGTVSNSKLREFILNLMFYGEINFQ